jgi:uncharacterized protein YraI
MQRIVFSAAVLSFALLGGAQAQTVGTATTDLNLRSGPGPEQPVIGLIGARQKARIIGCVDGSLWCQVEYRGKQGWAYSQYMTLKTGGGTVVVREPANVATVPVLTYDAAGYVTPSYRPDVAPVAAAITAPAAGWSTAPLGAPRPTVYTSTEGPPAAPPPAIGNYADPKTAPSFRYPGDVAVGASLPQTMVLNNVPDYRYQYVYVNDTAVLVDPLTRRIVYVFR